MKVSIIIPCYNSGAYLGACMDSVLAQTMEDFEAILIDDGSKDDTLAVAQAYAGRDARVRVLAQENRGVAAARKLVHLIEQPRTTFQETVSIPCRLIPGETVGPAPKGA